MKPIAKILIFCLTLLTINAICCAPQSNQCSPIPTDHFTAPGFDKKSPSEKIALAKQWLSLPPNAPRGLLFRTYASRLFGISINATNQDIEKSCQARELKFERLEQGFPEWCPLKLLEFESDAHSLWQGLVSDYIFAIPPFLSKEQHEVMAQKTMYEEYVRAKKLAGGNLEYGDWHASSIIRAFWLPKNTSAAQAWCIYTKVTSFGSQSDEDRIKRIHDQLREDALQVTQLPTNTADKFLFPRLSNILNAIQLDSPTAELSWRTSYWNE